MDTDLLIVIGCIGLAIWVLCVMWQYTTIMSRKSLPEQDQAIFGHVQTLQNRIALAALIPRATSPTALFLVALIALLLTYLVTTFSLSETLFRYRLSEAATNQKTNIKLAELAKFPWAEVCSHHPYDGDFKHPKSGRVYHAPTSAAHDGVWVLLFIGENGDPTYVSGSCKHGGVQLAEFSCQSRDQATIRLTKVGECATYEITSPS